MRIKKLDILIIKSFLGPLLLTFSISEFVLLLQALWKYLEKMIGKGLDTIIILKLIWYILVTLVPMALPLAILLASIMTLGNFSERSELVAMKSAGISLWRMLRPLIFVVSVFSVAAFFFSNNFMPSANNKMRTLLYEVKTKKPSISIRPGEFFTDIDNYIIRIGSKDKESKNMYNIIIYDHSQNSISATLTKAKSGRMSSEDNGNTLVLSLKDGCTYDESTTDRDFAKHPLMRISFAQQTIRLDISDFALQKSDTNRYSNHYKMMNIARLNENIALLTKDNEDFHKSMAQSFKAELKVKPSKEKTIIETKSFYEIYSSLSPQQKNQVKNNALEQTYVTQGSLSAMKDKDDADQEFIRRHNIEWHRKFTLSVACIILFFIGAPLGAIIKKGGFGLPIVVSVISFIIYYVIGMIGEKSALGGALSCFAGMWSSSIIFLPIGLFLTMKATTDSALLNIEGWQKLFRKLKSNFSKEKEAKE